MDEQLNLDDRTPTTRRVTQKSALEYARPDTADFAPRGGERYLEIYVGPASPTRSRGGARAKLIFVRTYVYL